MALEENFKSYRVNHYSWWEQELPSEEEMMEGITNLRAYGNEVDFIVSHCCAASTQVLIGGGKYKRDYLNEYLEKDEMVIRDGKNTPFVKNLILK